MTDNQVTEYELYKEWSQGAGEGTGPYNLERLDAGPEQDGA